MDKLIKYQIIEEIIISEDEVILDQIRSLLMGEDFWDKTDEVSQKSIIQGIKDYESGKIVPHEAVMEKYRPNIKE
ncbi:hypothetical protein M3O96_02025 [Aquiflexum sp. TKW24L]|uniref:hypothetical protein n=1 Tax=Aquiflexum sp. TKW24L TaxID=2942212 RepID=UPI0020C1794B|nr:hypothetical protein [Aquiflexum sp. TKW24L]MCL6257848.1 hypothetical protein [Aquiflexum sp. TKW24L]